DQPGLRQRRLQLGVVLDQRPRDAVANRARLTRLPAADDVDHDVERLLVVGQHQGLPHDHAAGLAREELVDGLVVDDDLAVATLDEHARDRRLASSGAVVIVADHRWGVRAPARATQPERVRYRGWTV